MNRMQKLGIDPNTVEGIEGIIHMCCSDIEDGVNGFKCKYPREDTTCSRCIAERLLEEIKTKKVQRGTTYKDFNKAMDDYIDYRETCAENNITAFVYADWLAEEIEVEDD